MRRLTLLIAALAAIPAAAAAHAFLDHAEPRVGSEGPAPQVLRLWFTEPVVAAFSRVSVQGPAGFGGAGAAAPAPGDRRALMVALKPPLPPGRYVVRWRVLSADTHVTQGDFAFVVRP